MSQAIRSLPHAQKESEDAKDIIKAHLGLVRFVASKFGFLRGVNEKVLEENDLIQFGLLGLLDAIDKFDHSKGVRFETYAVTRIRGAILDEMRKLDWLPRSVRKRSRMADQLAQEAHKEANRNLSAEELAAKFSLTLDEYQELMIEAKGANMDYRVSYDEDTSLISNLPSDPGSDPFETVSVEEIRMKMIEAVEALPQRERLIITLYYYETLTFKEIGSILRISESRVFQIHNSILKHFRRQLVELE